MSDPQRQEIIIENIPAELKQGRHWLCWRLECVKERWTKVPYRPFGPLRKARSNDPGTWGTFEQALRYWRSHPEITGIGIAFADNLVGIDLDHCIAEGEIQPWARAIIDRLRTYCERSPSETGVHCLARGSLPEKRRIVTLPNLGEGCRIEMYDARSPHYFTVTGAAIGEPRTIEPAQAALDELYAQYMRPQTPKAAAAPPQSTLSDEVILAKAQQAANASKFARLFRGDLTEYDGDHSKADLALCGILAFYTDDPAQIDRLFRRSALLRPKWDERHSRDNQTYGDLTIQKVLDPNRPRYGQTAGRSRHLTSHPPGDWRDAVTGPPPWLVDGAAEDSGTIGFVAERQARDSLQAQQLSPGGNGHDPPSAPSAGCSEADSRTASDDRGRQPAPKAVARLARYELPAGCNVFAYRAEDGGMLDLWYDLHGREWIYATGREEWYLWQGTHWVKDETRRLPRQMQSLLDAVNRQARVRLKEAEQIAEAKERAPAIEIAQAYIAASKRTRSRVLSIAAMAENLRAVRATALNEGNLLSLSNGTLDLDTFAFREHRKADLLTYCLPYPYDPQASCPRWKQFIAEVLVTEELQPDPDLATLYQELVGLSLTTDNRLETMIWQEGEGANGKSVATQTVSKLLGPLAMPVNFHTLGQPGNYDLAELAGKRVVFSTESKRGGKAAEELIKNLVSGEELLARPIYGRPFTLRPVLKLWWSMNDRPVITDTSDAIWRRMALIPFKRTFKPGERDTQLLSKLEAELSGILNWALVGLKRLRANGRLSRAAAVYEAVAEYRQASNPTAEWLAERTVPLAEADTGASALHLDYLTWCKLRGGEPLSAKNFGVELRRLGVAKKRFTEGYRYALGLVYRGGQEDPPADGEEGVV